MASKRPRRLTQVQRLVLGYVLEQAKQGKPAIIATGYKKTRVGYSSALQAEAVATCTTTLFFLLHNGFIEAVRGGSAPLKGEEAYEASDIRYRLTPAGEAALGAAPPSGVHTTEAEWKRRTTGVA